VKQNQFQDFDSYLAALDSVNELYWSEAVGPKKDDVFRKWQQKIEISFQRVLEKLAKYDKQKMEAKTMQIEEEHKSKMLEHDQQQAAKEFQLMLESAKEENVIMQQHWQHQLENVKEQMKVDIEQNSKQVEDMMAAQHKNAAKNQADLMEANKEMWQEQMKMFSELQKSNQDAIGETTRILIEMKQQQMVQSSNNGSFFDNIVKVSGALLPWVCKIMK